jgi:hypothetical protein
MTCVACLAKSGFKRVFTATLLQSRVESASLWSHRLVTRDSIEDAVKNIPVAL